MEILNKTPRPIAVPLPGGKKLRLGPRKSGQITPKASEHPPVKKMIEDGELEILDGGKKSTRSLGGGSGSSPGGSQHNPGTGVRHTGDR